MITTLLGLLAAAQSAPPAIGLRVEDLPNGRFRVIVTKGGRGADPDQMLRSELELRAEAARRCEGRGGAVPVDRGQINLRPDNRWENISTFACRTPPAPAATPPAGS
jgi:hypothetical protein